MSENQFLNLYRRVCRGETEAAEELIRKYEPQIRREIRLRLTDRNLRRVVDSMDICQSVLGNFFVRAAAGQFDFDHPEQMLRLLITMAKNKVIDQHRREKSRTDEKRPINNQRDPPVERTDQHPSVFSELSGSELIEKFQARFNQDERRTAEMRRDGKTWEDIGTALGLTSNAVRKRFTRTCDRICSELGLDE